MVFQPAVAGGNIYVGTNSGSLICLETGDRDDDGWLMWGADAASQRSRRLTNHSGVPIRWSDPIHRRGAPNTYAAVGKTPKCARLTFHSNSIESEQVVCCDRSCLSDGVRRDGQAGTFATNGRRARDLKTLWEQGPSELKQVCGALERRPAGGHDHSGHDAQDDARQRARRSERDVEEFGLVADQPRGGEHEPGPPADRFGVRRLDSRAARRHMIEVENLSPHDRAEIRRMLDEANVGKAVAPSTRKPKGEKP